MTKQAFLSDVKRSGLTDNDIKKLKFKLLNKKEILELLGEEYEKTPVYKIPYLSPQKKDTKFYRLKLLEQPKIKSGFAKGKEYSTFKYWQPANAPPRLYFPSNFAWPSFLKDTSKTLYITEGEKKAAKATKEGFTTIGLGGVWNWKSKKQKTPLVKDFDLVKWKGRKVIIVFDNDMQINSHVMHALNALSKELTLKGAMLHFIELPLVDEKLGFDDYLVNFGKKEFRKLEEQPFPASQELWQLNKELAYIENINSVLVIESGMIVRNQQSLINLAYANRTYKIFEGEKLREVNAAQEWLKWKFRRSHKKLVYEPGQEKIIKQTNEYNLWPGWGLEPKKGDISLWLDLIDYIFQDDEIAKKWFLQWLAYPLQHPGTKLLTSVVIHGIHQGTGKSFLGYIMGDIYGENFNVVTEDELHSAHNDWLVKKQFLLGEEITGTDRRRDSDRLKNMITREVVRINEKFVPGYIIKDCANSYFTSNHVDAFFLEAMDRRLFVWEVVGAAMAKSFYKALDKWRNNGGAAHLFDYLLKVDLKGFEAKSEPPYTIAKEKMIQLSKSDLDLFAQELKENPKAILRMGRAAIDKDLYTLDELLEFVPDNAFKPSKKALSKALAREKFVQKVVRTKQGPRRLWAIQNTKKYTAKADWRERAEKQHSQNVVSFARQKSG